jgi:hypothetical protein
MARASVISPYQKFWDLAGLIALSDGTVTFYQNQTTTLATVYSDPDLTVVQDNPYTLDSGGRIQGDVYFDDTLSLLLKDSNGASQYTMDNVTCFDPSAAFSEWNEFTVYGDGGSNIVTGPDGNYYVSIQDNNEGNTPATSPLWWLQINFFPGTSAGVARIEAISEITPANQAIIVGNGATWVGTTLAALTPNFLGGLVTSNAADADHDITVTAGRCNNSTNALSLNLAAAITKQIDATWVAGNNAGGLASGASLGNDTWYHVFVILVGSTVDVMFDTSVSCANGVANNAVTSFRRIGSVLTDGSANILPYFQSGDEFTWDAMVQDVNANDPGESAVTATLSVPIDVAVLAKFYGAVESGSATQDASLLFTALTQTNQVPSIAISNISIFAQTVDTNNFGALLYVETDTSAQIRYRLTVTSTATTDFTITVNTVGWIDFRGR